MTQIGWRFPPLSGGTRQGYTNNDIEVFKGQDLIDNLAREICQNSLDAHLGTFNNSNNPVRVVFELKQIEKDRYDALTEYSSCLKGCRAYWNDEMDEKLSRFVSGAEDTLKKSTIPVLVASDYNTTGLQGSHSRKIRSPWEALTDSDGVSVKYEDNSAGSYGIGKNAPFACSSLSMVFYNTVAENNESAFIGVARLATLLNRDGKPTQRVGKYQTNDEENERWTPIYPENANSLRDMFLRSERGTDVIIMGFKETDNWIDKVTKAVLKNFFVAISEGRLVVKLKENYKYRIIDSDSLSQLLSDYAQDAEMTGTVQLYKAFTCPDFKTTTEIIEPNDVEVYIKSDSNYKRTIANFRATGMLVGTYRKQIIQHYAAVVIIRGDKLGKLLKDTEPPKHNKWDYRQIDQSDKQKRKDARHSIKKIEDFVFQLLKKQFEVITEDKVDAAGVGEYIPDDFDGMGNQSGGDDILRVKVKIGKIRINSKRSENIIQTGTREEGTAQGGEVRNHNRNPRPIPHMYPHPPRPVAPGLDHGDLDSCYGAAAGNGTKIVITPNLIAQRAFPISISQGLYKIVIKPTESYNNLFVECFAVGEDSRFDVLELESFTLNGTNVSFSGGKAGPVKVKANIPAIFFARFKNKEKMKLNLQLTEVVKR